MSENRFNYLGYVNSKDYIFCGNSVLQHTMISEESVSKRFFTNALKYTIANFVLTIPFKIILTNEVCKLERQFSHTN